VLTLRESLSSDALGGVEDEKKLIIDPGRRVYMV